jgi:hypothetical protein
MRVLTDIKMRNRMRHYTPQNMGRVSRRVVLTMQGLSVAKATSHASRTFDLDGSDEEWVEIDDNEGKPS